MSERQNKLLEKLNLDKEHFEPNNDGITINDVVDMISTLSEIVLMGEN